MVLVMMMMLDYRKKISFFLLFLFFSSGNSKKGKEWSYFADGGTKGWKADNMNCRGRQQSPIDIVTPIAVSQAFGPIEISNYNAATTQVLLKNTGYTVKATFQIQPLAKISGGGLKEEYIGHHFHLHWSSSDDYGSEHYKDGTAFPMEMHIVHYSSKYKSIGEAWVMPEGLAVLGFFFIITTANNSILQDLIDKLPKIGTIGEQVNFNAQLGDLIPKNRSKFYRYAGSLTTPPCHETVVWTVFESTITVSPKQMKEFRSRLEMTSPGPKRMLYDNYREIQPMYERTIYVNTAGPIQHKALIVTLIIGVHCLSSILSLESLPL